MERRDIEIFLELGRELHFGRAAENLHVSTARVSQTIKKLERRIGAPLFERTSRRVALTPIGRRLYDDLDPAYRQIREGVDRAVAAGRGVDGVLRVGFVGTAVGRFVLEVADVFRARHPTCQVQIRESPYSDGTTPLDADEIDVLLAVVQPPRDSGLTASPVLFREDPMLAVSARHPFARRASVSLDDLARDRVLRPRSIPEHIDEALVPRRTPNGEPIERGPAFGTVQEMFALVGAGKGVFPVPTHAARYDARPDVAYVPIPDGSPFEWRLLWRTTAETSRVRAFTQAALDHVAANENPLTDH
ncbi:LysR family transcriptional regulator [Streptosporangium carneum]|uniref:LysR family transcriptional regulator n=1 Tax=Streptosporangium carneum TaxID=47481 RepID=UPI0022F339AA|nr:LysR family transcriptional regulator [Streptosporangium carneum]